MDDKEFNRFKAIKGRLGADTNDEALVELMDSFENKQSDDDGDFNAN